MIAAVLKADCFDLRTEALLSGQASAKKSRISRKYGVRVRSKRSPLFGPSAKKILSCAQTDGSIGVGGSKAAANAAAITASAVCLRLIGIIAFRCGSTGRSSLGHCSHFI